MRGLSCKTLLILLVSTAWCYESFAEEIDLNRLYRCDSLFCPSGSTNNTEINENLRTRTGIVIQPASSGNFPQIQRRRINIEPYIEQPTPQGTGRISPQGVGSTSNNSSVNNENPQLSQSSLSNRQQPTGLSSASGTNQFNSPSGANNNSQLKAGLLYSNDDESPSPLEKIETKNQTGTALTNLAPQANPVVQNLKNNSAGGVAPESTYKPSSGTSASDFGIYQSGSPTPAKGIFGQIKEGFADIAESLGKKFFGDLGGKSSRGLSGSSSKTALEQKSKFNTDKANDINPRDILKKGLAQFNNRGLANQLEFGASNSFLFGNICQHYVNYAEKNRIPNDRSPCPMK